MLCTNCGKARTGTEKYCTACGKRFPEPSFGTEEPQASDRDYPRAAVDHDATGSRPVRTPRAATRRLPTAPIVALLLVVLAAAVVGTWYAIRKAPSANTAIPRVTRSSSAQPSGSTPTVTSSSPLPSSTEQQTSPANGLVSLAPAAAQYSDADSIQPVITEYFQAINNRDYTKYLATQSPGVALTPQQFQTGFRSTEDSSVIVTNIAIAPDGRPEADVTFTSQQQPQDGPNGESCTNWQVKMFLDGNAGTYTIGALPADYSASYQPCS